jgi:hypothetical protein
MKMLLVAVPPEFDAVRVYDVLVYALQIQIPMDQPSYAWADGHPVSS